MISAGAVTYTDLSYERTPHGYYDLVIDATSRDFATTDGLESALFVSFFSDRRARPDEVADPLKRRGWIGDLVSEVPGDLHGSGLWLYEQRRLTREVAIGLRIEGNAAVEWMIEAGLIQNSDCAVLMEPAHRRAQFVVSVTEPDGGETTRAYLLADRTIARTFATTTAVSTTVGDAREDALEWGGERINWGGVPVEWD